MLKSYCGKFQSNFHNFLVWYWYWMILSTLTFNQSCVYFAVYLMILWCWDTFWFLAEVIISHCLLLRIMRKWRIKASSNIAHRSDTDSAFHPPSLWRSVDIISRCRSYLNYCTFIVIFIFKLRKQLIRNSGSFQRCKSNVLVLE